VLAVVRTGGLPSLVSIKGSVRFRTPGTTGPGGTEENRT
jgi:hypothetical protein